jgi:acyl-CoA thioesterase FadM
MSDPAAAPAVPDPATALLHTQGFRYVVPIATTNGDYDEQGHLNNAATVRVLNDLRIRYVTEAIGETWTDFLRTGGFVVAARELHVLYESEALPGEQLVGGMRYLYWEGKASVLEEVLVEADQARPVARAWLVHLLVKDGKVVDWPDLYLELVGRAEGRVMERRPKRERPPWGPPP